MEMQIKQLKQGSQIIVPQTVAEAVLINTKNNTITLNEALSYKQNTLITPAESGLVQYPQNNSVILMHSNNVTATDTLESRLIKYDNNGHITESAVEGKIIITLNNEKILESGTTIDQSLNLGDDFRQDDNIIGLNWNSF